MKPRAPFPTSSRLPTVKHTQIKPRYFTEPSKCARDETRAECQPHRSPFLPRPQMLHSNTRYICRENEQAEDPKKQSEGVGLCTVCRRYRAPPPCFFFLHPFHHAPHPHSRIATLPPSLKKPNIPNRSAKFRNSRKVSACFPAAGDKVP